MSSASLFGAMAGFGAAVTGMITYGKMAKHGYDVSVTMSPTRAAAANIISARCYIVDTLQNIPEVALVFKTAHLMYCSLVSTILYNRAGIERGVSAQDAIGSVATRSSWESYSDSVSKIDSLNSSMEFMGIYQKDHKIMVPQNVVKYDQNGNRIGDDDDVGATHDIRAVETKSIRETMFAAGTTLTINTTQITPNGTPFRQQYTITVRIDPYAVSPQSMEHILEYGLRSPKILAKLHRNSHEVGFWNKFVNFLNMNKAEKSDYEIAKNDKDFGAFLRDRARKQRVFKENRADALLTGSLQRASANLANTILFVDEETVRHVKAKTGLDFTHESIRDKFFDQTFAMMMFVFDQHYQRVTIYMNGLDIVSHMTYADFKDKQKMDANMILQMMAGANSSAVRNNRF